MKSLLIPLLALSLNSYSQNEFDKLFNQADSAFNYEYKDTLQKIKHTMKNHYVTFGQIHVHCVNGQTLDKDTVAVFKARDAKHGRDVAVELFGDKFFTDYHGEDWNEDKLSWFPKGYVDLGFIPKYESEESFKVGDKVRIIEMDENDAYYDEREELCSRVYILESNPTQSIIESFKFFYCKVLGTDTPYTFGAVKIEKVKEEPKIEWQI